MNLIIKLGRGTFRKFIKFFELIFFNFYTDELSMDPSVRLSPFADPPENETKLTWNEKFNIRRRRIFFFMFHVLALVGLFYCLTGRVKLYTILWSK